MKKVYKIMKKYTIPAVVAVIVAAGVVGVALTNEKPVVSVNGVGISKEMVDEHMQSIPAQLIQGQEDSIRKNIVDRLVDQELILQDATATKITESDDYKTALEKLTRNFTYNYMLNKVISEKVNDDVLMSAYEEKKADFVMPRAKARHILVKTEDEAKAIIKELDAGKDFAELAKEKSVGPSASNGGDLGSFGMADMVPAFAKAAFDLDAGTYSKEPVQTQFGWHVILLEEKDMDATLPFENVKQQLAKALSEQAAGDYLTSLRDAADIEYSAVSEEAAEPAMDESETTETPAESK